MTEISPDVEVLLKEAGTLQYDIETLKARLQFVNAEIAKRLHKAPKETEPAPAV